MLADKLQEFYDALVAIKTALIAKDVVVSKFTLDQIAELVGQVETSRDMGVQEVTFVQNAIVYGIKITEKESDPVKRVAYIDDAQGMLPVSVNTSSGVATYNNWDKTWLFDKIYPVMLRTNGTIAYKLDPNDLTKKIDGSNSDIANTNFDGNAMVCVEKFYTKFSMDGENEVIEISDTKLDGFTAFGFTRSNGAEADKIFLSIYRMSTTLDSNGKKVFRSLSGQQRDTLRAEDYIRLYQERYSSDPNHYFPENFITTQLYLALFHILFKRTGYYDAFGKNPLDTSQSSTSGTGKSNQIGAIGFSSDQYNLQYCRILKFMYRENFWTFENTVEYGFNNVNNRLIIKNRPPYNSAFTSGAVYIDFSKYSGNNLNSAYVSKMECDNSYGRRPIEFKGNNKAYECFSYSISTPYLFNPDSIGQYHHITRGIRDCINSVNGNPTGLIYIP